MTAVIIHESLEEAIKAYAKANNLTMSDLIRTSVAGTIGFDMTTIPASAPRTKYANEEDRKAAQKSAAEKRRKVDAAMLKAVKTGNREEVDRLMALEAAKPAKKVVITAKRRTPRPTKAE